MSDHDFPAMSTDPREGLLTTKRKSEPKTEIFGTMLAPNLRWTCGRCGTRNVTRANPPLRAKEITHCRKCHRASVFGVDMAKLPTFWGGQAASAEMK